MDENEFEIVENKKSQLARHSLERLKALAPTFPERSRERLACVELIAEREQAMARVALREASRRATLALFLSVVALVVPVILFVAWTFLQSKPQTIPRPLEKPRPVSISTPTPIPIPIPEPPPSEVVPESTPEPLPAVLGELPATPVGE